MKLNAIDIFSGAGGMSLGAKMAGITVDIAVEFDKDAAATFQFNHPKCEVFDKDISKFSFKNREKKNEIFVLFGGPPCQGFSVSNTKTRNEKNEKNSLFNEFIRLVEEVQPKWFVFENVEGITSFKKGAVVKELEERFKQIGYNTSHSVLIASEYSVPQNRNRFFMVGNNQGIEFTFPKKAKKRISVKEAIFDLPYLNNGDKIDELPYRKIEIGSFAKKMRKNSTLSKQNLVSQNQEYVIERYKHIKVGENWKAIPPKLMKNYSNTDNCHSGIYRRLHPDKPSVVIANYRKNMLIHPYQNRGLSVREAARIQSFPDDFIFKGTLMSIQQQIGNAVPPLLAKAIFKQIVKLQKQNE